MSWKDRIPDFSACDAIIEELDALEQAIADICLPDIVREIQDRKRMILKR